MKLQTFVALLILVIFISINWKINSNKKILLEPANAVIQLKPSPVGRIIATDGAVLLKRHHWPEYRPVFVGTELYAEDKIKLSSEANLMAICYANWKIWNVPKNTISQIIDGCLQAKSKCVETPDGCVPFDATRGMNQISIYDNIPYVITPRHTLLLSDKPLIMRWNPVTGATRYTVIIKSLSEYIWETEVSQNQVIYSGEFSFTPGVRYTVIVHADTGVSSLDEESPFSQQDSLGRGFALISQSQQQQILTITKQLNQQLDDEAQVLTIAEFYQQNGLNLEAIATLESFLNQGNETAAVYGMLGELYQQIQLPNLAKDYYLKSAELIAVDDVTGSAKIEVSLGKIYANLGKKKEAIIWLDLAYNRYQNLGEFQRGNELKQWMEKLNQQLLEESNQ